MKRLTVYSFTLLFVLTLMSGKLWGINTKDTKMLAQPAISAGNIAFIYAGDLWIADSDGSQPRKLTADEGIESNPYFSPDGKLIAFSAQYDGNTDVFIIPVEGGNPTRLTWHPGNDIVRGFTPDGQNVMFTSQRSTFTYGFNQLFTVKITGGYPEKLEIPNASSASYSPDGKYLAYTPLGPVYQQWKHYRGGTISNIWIYSFTDHSVVKIPQPQEGCNDADPMWVNDKIFFISDRNGEFNLFSYDLTSKDVKQLTSFTDFPILKASHGNGKIVFEQEGYLHTYDIASNAGKKLTVGIAADLLELRTRFVQGNDYIRWFEISPAGSRVVFDFRGDIITLPAEKGDPRNITLTTGVHEKFPSWSPDGKTIAYFSDASGEYALHIKSQDGKGDPKVVKLNGAGFYAYINWSPDSKKISFVDNGRNLYILDIELNNIRKIDSDDIYSPGAFRQMFGDWSSDSRWIVYTKLLKTNFQEVYLYSLDQQKSFPVTDGMSDASDPVFDPKGEYICFFASTDAGPVVNWFDLSSVDMKLTNSIYLATLRKDIASPFAKESDEESIEKEKSETPKPVEKNKKAGKTQPARENSDVLRIEPDGIADRIVNLPIKAGDYSDLAIGDTGQVFYIVRPSDPSSSSMLHNYDIKERKDNEVMELDNFEISANRKKMAYMKGEDFGITETGKKPEPGKGILNTQSISVKIDPLSEWPAIFDEAWRVNRDYFYDPGMHGADWNGMKTKYSKFLPDLACRSDLNRVLQWMFSELSIGHHYITSGGEKLNNPKNVKGGLLGADFVISENRYRISKIYGGLNWNPDLRSPLTEPGLNIRKGDYILAVNGNDVTADKNLFSFFENTSEKIVELTINNKSDYTGSRVVKVVPVENEFALRNRDWVEGNLKRVTEATNGQVAYVYVPNTANEGHEYFKRYFFPQANRKAVIIDERFNGGGLLADYYIDILQRPLQAYWATRSGSDMKSPGASIQGPKVMIINENAGSGGDMLPWMFRKFNVGTLVGKRTWGGLVGILGFPEFVDGGAVTAPNIGIWTKDGFIIENVGIAPDIEVEQWPADVINGKDPQLEKAIQVALDELAKHPPEEPVRPPFPVKARK